MKKILFLLLGLSFTVMSQALTVESTAGNLSDSIVAAGGDLAIVDSLTVTGTIDARDFKMMRDSMPVLSVLDLSGVDIVAYTGIDGTFSVSTTVYLANEVPKKAFFYDYSPYKGKESLTSVILPTSITSIEYYAFRGCEGLTSVDIPPLVSSIKGGAFYLCKGLTSVTLPISLTSLSYQSFFRCEGLTSIDIPSSVNRIESQAFLGCIGLTTLTIPSSVTFIDAAFRNCTGLKTVYYNSNAALEYFPFSGCSALETIVIGSNVKTIPNEAFGQTSALTSVTIPSSVTSIGDYAFSECTSLVSLNIPSSVTSIGDAAFNKCSSLTSMVIPSSVTFMGDRIFYNCSSLNSVTISSSATAIRYAAFYGCSSLTSITIPQSIRGVESEAFTGCDSLSVINFNATNCTDAFSHPFFDCSNTITTLNIGDNVKRIPYLLFTSFVNVTSLSIPTSVTTIEDEGFWGFSKITSLAIPLSVTSIGKEAFIYFHDLTSVTIPSSITTLKYSLFQGCTSLATVIIPSSVNSIEGSVFYNCSSLSSLYNYKPLPVDLSTSTSVFLNVDKSKCTLYVPTGSKALYEVATEWKDFQNIVEFDSVFYKSLAVSSGNLSTSLTKLEKETITKLKLSGTIDARDIFFMRDSMPILSEIDLKEVTIEGYTGLIDTVFLRSSMAEKTFPANTLPITSFKNKVLLTNIALPASLIDIQDEAFRNCYVLDTVKLNNSIPIDLSSTIGVFKDVDISACKLLVPVGSESNYRAVSIWQDFLGMETETGIAYTTANSNKTFQTLVQDGKLFISNLEQGECVAVYNLQGTAIYKQQANSEMVSINLPARGVYVVKVGEHSVKVIN